MRLNVRLKKVLATTAVATMMVGAVPVVTYAADYDAHWAKAAITKWSEKEVLEGYEDGTFKPNNKVTRGELAAIIVRVFGLTDTSSAKKYTDVEATKWYAADIAKVSSADIMNDYEDGTFKAEQEATREEAAYAIAKAYKVATQETNVIFKDQAQISDWAESEIASLVAGGYLNGNPDGTFRPTASLTRAEAVTMIDKITADLVNVAGTYSQDVEGHLVVNTKGVELKDMTITGNLYLAEGIGEGDVKLDNVTVLGDIIVEGGGINTVNILGQSKINNIYVDKAGKNPVYIKLGNLIEVKGTVTLQSTCMLEGHGIALNKVVVNGAVEPQLIGTLKVEEAVVDQTTELVLVDGVKINQLTVTKDAVNTIIRGRGEKSELKDVKVEADGLEFKKGFKFNKDKVQVAEHVTIPPKYPQAGGGGGGGSSSGGSSSGSGAVTDKAINVSALNVALQGDTVKNVPVNNKIAVVVDSQSNKVTVNGVDFQGSDVIESITAIEDHGINALTVGLAATKYSVELKAGEAYTIESLKGIVKDNKENAINLLSEILKKAQFKGKQIEKAVTRLNTEIKRIEDYSYDNISVQVLLDAAKEIRNEVKDEQITQYYEQLKTALETMGVSLNISEGQFVVEGQLTVQATSAHEIDQVTIEVTYK